MRKVYLNNDEVNGAIKDIISNISLESLEVHKQDYKDGFDINQTIEFIISDNEDYANSEVRYEVSNDIYTYLGHGEYRADTDYTMETKSLYEYIIECEGKDYFVNSLKDRFREIA